MFSLSPTTSQFLSRFSEVALRFPVEKKNDFAKVWSYSLAWTSMALDNDDPNSKLAGNASGFFRDVKNFISFTEMPMRAKMLLVGVKACWQHPSLTVIRNVFCVNLTSVIVPTCDTLDLAGKFLPIPKRVLETAKVVNFGATLVGTGFGAAIEAYDICTKEESKEEKILHFINVMRNVSYVVLGIIGLASLVPAVGFVATPWMYLACVTSGLTFGIGGFFYENLAVKPERDAAKAQLEEQNFERRVEQRVAEQVEGWVAEEVEKQLEQRLAEEVAQVARGKGLGQSGSSLRTSQDD